VEHLTSIDLDRLREERQRLARECDRLTWLRRLVTARRDLEVARLTGAGAGLWGAEGISPAVRRSLDDEVTARCPELLTQLSQSVRTLSVAVDGAQRDLDAATGELVRRYTASPRLCLSVATHPVLVETAG
jgi:hypothetical protein